MKPDYSVTICAELNTLSVSHDWDSTKYKHVIIFGGGSSPNKGFRLRKGFKTENKGLVIDMLGISWYLCPVI